MKKYFKSRKLIYLIVTFLAAAAFYGILASTLHAESSYVPEDNVREMNYERSSTYVDGEGYQFESEVKKKTTKEIKEKKEPERKPAVRKPAVRKPIVRRPVIRRPVVRRTPVRRSVTPDNKTKPKKEASKKEKPKKEKPKKEKSKKEKSKKKDKDKEKEEASENPVITISLEEGEEISGPTAEFTVTAVSSKGDAIPADRITVLMNEERIFESSENTYIGTVVDGENRIVATAVDENGNESKIVRKIVGNVPEPPKKTGSVKIVLTAAQLGIDVVAPEKSVDIYEKEQLSDVIARYFGESAEVSMADGKTDSFEMDRIEKPGIIDEIPDEIIKELDSQGISLPEDKDSLGRNDFGPESGWVYKIDGETYNQYMSGLAPVDGSEIEIYYTLTEV